MNILFLTRKGEGYVGAPQTHYEFEQTVAKYAECKWAGEDWPLYEPKEKMNETVERVMPNADWVIDRDNNLHNPKPKDRDYKIGFFMSDLHGKHHYKISNPVEFAEVVNNVGYDAIFMRYPLLYGTQYRPEVIYDRLSADKYWVPWSMDINKFRPRRPYKWDVTFMGMVHAAYPLRQRIWNNLYFVARGYRILRQKAPTGHTFERFCDELRKTHLVGEDYAETLGYTRILLFGCSKYRYPIQKFFEGTSAKCLVMSNAPSMAKRIGFRHGDTYIDVDERDWEDALQYFLENPQEAAKIARRGMKMTLQHHSHDVRAEQWVKMLEGGKDGYYKR